MMKKSDRILNDIKREYDRMRLENAALLEERKQEVFLKIPAYKELMQGVRRTELQTLLQTLGKETEAGDTVMDSAAIKSKKESLLVAAGYPADYLSMPCRCKKCEDTGYLKDAYGARSIRCSCYTKKLAERLSEESGLSELLETENFDHLSLSYYEGEDLANFQRALTACRDFLANKEGGYKNFFFYGNIGTGKSFLSCCVAKALLDQGKEVVYFSSAKLFDKLAEEKNPARRDQEEDTEPVRSVIYDCDLLILDDLGTEWFNNFVFSEIFALINERIRRKKATIISTNLTLQNLTQIYSERILSRISSHYLMCKFTGDDIRMEKTRRRQTSQK